MIEEVISLNLGKYARSNVSNLNSGQPFFDQGLRLLFAYQHELAANCFLECIRIDPKCALAHTLIAYCHGPNYNLKGKPFYDYSYTPENNILYPGDQKTQLSQPRYPSQVVADFHSQVAVDLVEEMNYHGTENSIEIQDRKSNFSNVEIELIKAIRILTSNPGLDSSVSEKQKDVPFSLVMRDLYDSYPDDPEIIMIYVASVMTIHAWKLYQFPSGKPLSDHVTEIESVLEEALILFPSHVGLCHMFCHLCEMSCHPEKALKACDVLRISMPDAGHILHMPTHIDVLIGDYEACVRWNLAARKADDRVMKAAPEFNNPTSFYFGYICHNYHMLVYGAILGAMEKVAMESACKLNEHLNEKFFEEKPHLCVYLEAYAALDIHTLIRFGRWKEIIQLKFPNNQNLMLYRTASLHYARAISLANLGNIKGAREEVISFRNCKNNPLARFQILHNNTIYNILCVDYAMMEGEIAYFEGKYEDAFKKLRNAIDLEDALNYDEPWGKMQPVRHTLGGLLLNQNFVNEAETVFRQDLKQHPKNPWGLVGLIGCLTKRVEETKEDCSCESGFYDYQKKLMCLESEIQKLRWLLQKQRQSPWADFKLSHACACCNEPVV